MSPDGATANLRSVAFTPTHIVKRQAAAWDGVRAETVQVTERLRFDYSFRGPQHLLIASERAERSDGETWVEELKSAQHDLSRKLTFIPANTRFRGWQDPRIPSRATFFYIDPNGPLLDPAAGFDSAIFEPRLFFFDIDIWETTQKLAAQVGEQRSGLNRYAEALAAVLCHELLRLNRGERRLEPKSIGGLAAWQKKRIEEYVAEHLSEHLSLARMAELVRLSPYHFSRAFKRSFGVPPHRFHAIRRVEEAKSLLANVKISVTEIGMRLGFTQTSAFTSAFNKIAGMSPTQFRRTLE